MGAGDTPICLRHLTLHQLKLRSPVASMAVDLEYARRQFNPDDGNVCHGWLLPRGSSGTAMLYLQMRVEEPFTASKAVVDSLYGELASCVALYRHSEVQRNAATVNEDALTRHVT